VLIIPRFGDPGLVILALQLFVRLSKEAHLLLHLMVAQMSVLSLAALWPPSYSFCSQLDSAGTADGETWRLLPLTNGLPLNRNLMW
jgi:hypothetical protein